MIHIYWRQLATAHLACIAFFLLWSWDPVALNQLEHWVSAAAVISRLVSRDIWPIQSRSISIQLPCKWMHKFASGRYAKPIKTPTSQGDFFSDEFSPRSEGVFVWNAGRTAKTSGDTIHNTAVLVVQVNNPRLGRQIIRVLVQFSCHMPRRYLTGWLHHIKYNGHLFIPIHSVFPD